MAELMLHGPWRIGSIWTVEDLRKQVKKALSRVHSSLLPATLSLEQWIVTVDHFAGRCAYCRRRRFEMLEHVVSVAIGGGTTAGNCLPACFSCNAKKSNKHIRDVFPRVAASLEEYLSARSTGKDVGRPPQRVIKFRAALARETRWMSSIVSLYFDQRPIDRIVKWLDNYEMWTDEELEERRRIWRQNWGLAP